MDEERTAKDKRQWQRHSQRQETEEKDLELYTHGDGLSTQWMEDTMAMHAAVQLRWGATQRN